MYFYALIDEKRVGMFFIKALNDNALGIPFPLKKDLHRELVAPRRVN